MSKRARPLSDIGWELLGPGRDQTKRARFGDDDEGENSQQEDGDDIEEETVHIDEEMGSHNNHHGLAILNSMTVDKSSITHTAGNSTKGGITAAAAAAQEDVPTVPLDDHYNTLYNRMMNRRFPQQFMSESSEEDESDAGDMEDDLFHSLGNSSTSDSPHTRKKSNKSSSNDPAIQARRKERVRKLVQSPAYDTQEREECFLCSWGNRHHDGIKAKYVNALHDIMEQQYNVCNNVDLALQLELYYKKKVYRPNCGMSMLTKEIALEHIEGLHSLSATLFLGESIRACKKIMFGMQNAIFKANTKYDKEAINQFKEMLKLLCMLYKMNPDQMLFNYGKTREDTASMGRPFNIMTQLKQVRDKDRRSKQTKQLNSTNASFQRGFDI